MQISISAGTFFPALITLFYDPIGREKFQPMQWFVPHQRWAEGPIVRSSDTDSIFRLYRPTQSIDFKFRLLYRAIVSVRFKVRFLYRAIVSVPYKVRFLYRAIVSVCFKVRFFNRPILCFGLGSDCCIDRFYRTI